MGLDIYVGTLTRYYKHNWKTVVQKMAEKMGVECKIVRAYEEIEVSVEQVLSDTKQWEEDILKAITPKGEPFPPWNEDYDTTPYYTDKPDWDAIGALMMYIAYLKYDQVFPKTIKKGYDYYNNEYVKKAREDKDFVFSLIQGGGWWVPLDDTFMFQFPLMNGKNMYFGTAGLLKRELETINSKEWKASPEEIVNWSKTEGYPADITIKPKDKMKNNNDNNDNNNDNSDNNNDNNDNNDSNSDNNNDDKKPQNLDTKDTTENTDVYMNKVFVNTSNETTNDNNNNNNDNDKNAKYEIVNRNIHDTYDPLSLAKFAFSIMWQAADFSLKHRVLIIYDS